MRSYTSETVSRQVFLDVLWAAYGTTNEQKTTPMIGSDYSLIIFTVNETGSYKYIPETKSLAVHDQTVNKETIRPYNTDWPSDAKEVLVIVWDKNRMSNQYFAAAEAGCVAQNVHLAATSYGLGTCVVGSIDGEGLSSALKLTSNLTPILVMPLSYPTNQYPAATPDYDIMTENLPVVQNTEASVKESIQNMVFTQQWSPDPLTMQEHSQLLWAAYGYTSTDHRTTPSSYGIYPLVVYAADTTGIYKYQPESHSFTQISSGDKRFDISNTFSGQTWAADAPTIFVIGYDMSYNGGVTGDGGVFSHLFIEVNTGCVIQQLLLEASALNLQANILSEGLEEWNGAGAQQLRSILGLSSSIIPLYAVPVGGAEGGDRTAPAIGNVSQEPSFDMVEPSQTVTVSAEVTDDGVGVKEAVLVYSIDGGQTWINAEMAASSGNGFTGQIQGFEEGKQVHYKIVAYDNNNNIAVKDNAGNYYIYTVIPEFQSIILAFIISMALAAVFSKKRNK
jgi:nitroreductase